VVEVAYFLAGPLAATLLGELGARVIKVEPPGGDPGRRTGLQSAKLLHGKESVVIDLKTAPGLGLLEDLVDGADVFLHSFRPGVAERLGVGSEALLARNPRLIYAYAASYGSKGPQARRAAFHSTPNALVGSGILQAGAGNPPVDDSYPDPGSALGVATAILLALHGRSMTGRGQALETTMLTTAGYVMAPYTTRPESGGAWRLPDARQLGLGALARLYPCSEGWVYVGAVSERDWPAIATTVGRSEWITDPRFADPQARQRHDALLTARMAETLATEAATVWEQRARERRAPLVVTAMVAKDRWMEDHKLLIEAQHPLFGEYWRPPVRVDFADADPRLDPASAPGEHTRAILAQLGRDRAETDRLLEDGIVQAWEPIH
jgi:crotonobetainyl-CoA:carnitine CoA-transferase CaiB-like acyl-CoA transferase